MRSIAAIVIAITLLGASGCFRPGPGRSGNIALIAVGGTMMVGTLVKSQFPGDDSPSGWHVDPTPVLVTFFAVGLATAVSGIIGLTMKPQ